LTQNIEDLGFGIGPANQPTVEKEHFSFCDGIGLAIDASTSTLDFSKIPQL
jgi:hypothetical protein